ncbi:spore cortex-lytic enzyme [Hydrogenoanaerobacterium sp.]|uniref:spore cortex-lytic enzyme n=1 Tax=Hydrogenoanaerobacterium sp. TaxID=2953763 RepID=UPI0028A0E3AA|nr:spore cortex-lytic enzyme [Hydrogenoanaerobacterium sp.]
MTRKIIPILKLMILIALNILMIGLVTYASRMGSVDALSRVGSRGNEVRQIQTKLKQWGYMTGAVDGIFGPQTEKGVRYFQQKNGLNVDGIAGPQTLRAMGISSSSGSSGGSTSSGGVGGYSDSDYRLLARVISAEARGETYEGQVAVGGVIINRVKHPSFPNTLSGVIYQPGAFTAITDGQINQPVADSAYRAAKDSMNGWDASGGAIYYYNPDKTSNQWMRTRPVIKRIGKHLFCK